VLHDGQAVLWEDNAERGTLAIGLCLIAASAYAEVSPEQVIAPSNAALVKIWFRPACTTRHSWDADEHHRARAGRIGRRRTGTRPKSIRSRFGSPTIIGAMVGYVAGQAFRLIDSERSLCRDQESCDTTCSADQHGRLRSALFTIARASTFVRVRIQKIIGRHRESATMPDTTSSDATEVEPLPVDPDFKQLGSPVGIRLYPVLAPQEARGHRP